MVWAEVNQEKESVMSLAALQYTFLQEYELFH